MRLIFKILIIIITNLVNIDCYINNHDRQSETKSLGLCQSDIYCYGNLLHLIQMNQVYNDSKSFVDSPTRLDKNIVIENFFKLITTNKTITREDLLKFVNENFHQPGHDTIKTDPIDWQTLPKYIKKLTTKQNLFLFANEINLKWKILMRKFDPTTICNTCSTSAILTNNSFIVPGGRFIEYYYWDSYWVIEALLISEMTQSARNMIQNFLDIIELNGFIPNGARIYYLNRSQPPLLIQMVYTYFNHTNDINFLRSSIKLLDKEYEYWMNEKSVLYKKNNVNYILNRYYVSSDKPRPESYREDYLNANEHDNINKTNYYSNIMTACESGWDFSSRWFIDPFDIKTITILDMIPVDLNSILYKNEMIMYEFYSILNNFEKAKFYKYAAIRREEAINNVLWDENVNSYGDLNTKTSKIHNEYLYITDLAPLWNGIRPNINPELIIKRYESILKNYVSGIPASNVFSEQQWDYPNVWAPYHQWIVEYFVQNNKRQYGLDIAKRFVSTVYCGWTSTGNIYEKYNADILGGYGNGGEYIVQEGFGWTNAVVIKFMDMFDIDLNVTCDLNSNTMSSYRPIVLQYYLLIQILIFFLFKFAM